MNYTTIATIKAGPVQRLTIETAGDGFPTINYYGKEGDLDLFLGYTTPVDDLRAFAYAILDNLPVSAPEAPKLPTEDGFYRDCDGDLWTAHDGVWTYLESIGKRITPRIMNPEAYLPFTRIATETDTHS